ncbi:MAG: hypothetical protein ACYS1A_08085 [Planctomycetota bacterium]|jgi:septal ring factor EnvC (AmiA/AmiB activator)
MKPITIATLVLMLLLSSLIFTAGCRQQQLTDCSGENKLLRQTIEEQKTEIERLEQVEHDYAMVVIKIVTEMDNVKKELTKIKKENDNLKKAAEGQKAKSQGEQQRR